MIRIHKQADSWRLTTDSHAADQNFYYVNTFINAPMTNITSYWRLQHA